jgi:hypothetical protein
MDISLSLFLRVRSLHNCTLHKGTCALATCVQEILRTLSARIPVNYPSFISKYLAKVQGA